VHRFVRGGSEAGLPYRLRKQRYIEHLAVADLDACVVAAADKLHNARAILADYRIDGDKLWARFNADRETLHWYYKGVADALDRRLAGHRAHAMVDELRGIVAKVWGKDERPERRSS
jgi:GTP pyrophosphokinase